MTRIDFYILKDTELSARYLFACKLIQKTIKLGHRIYVHCADESQSSEFSQLLWSFKDSSFIPNDLQASDDRSSDVLIGSSPPPHDHHDLLLNLDGVIPSCFSRFERVAEIVVQNADVLAATRSNYRLYVDKNYPLHRHDMR